MSGREIVGRGAGAGVVAEVVAHGSGVDPDPRPHTVTDHLWVDGAPVAGLDLTDGDDPGAALARVRGHFALHRVTAGGEHVLARDPLGVNKLFYALTPGGVESSNHWIDLVRRGHPSERVWSVPSGHVVHLDPARRRYSLVRYAEPIVAEGDPTGPDDVGEHAARVRDRLEETFRMVAAVAAGRPVYVSLSGGLDSTTVAVLARELVGPFTAVTFAVDEGGPAGPGSRPDDDLTVAGRVADDLGVPLLAVLASPEEVLASVDDVLCDGQDWRDFNVHCGLVNAAVGRAVSAHAGPGPRPLLLTGDTMNELVADYTPVVYRGREHYSLPRLAPAKLRRWLVTGLDSGDREVGVLARAGVDVVQPYALCADAYLAVPTGLVTSPGGKQALAREVMGDRVPPYVYERPKVRAQVGGEEVAGTLGVLVDRGIDGDALARRFASLFGLEVGDLGRFIRAGYYRFALRYPQ